MKDEINKGTPIWFMAFNIIASCHEPKKIIRDTYLALDKSTGYIKIGRSANTQNRIGGLMNANPSIMLLATAEGDVERELHIKYAHKNVRGEWFDLSNKDIDDIIFEHCFMVELN